MQQSVIERIEMFRGLIKSISNNPRLQGTVKQSQVLELIEAVSVFEIEVLCQQQNWKSVEIVLQLHTEVFPCLCLACVLFISDSPRIQNWQRTV